MERVIILAISEDTSEIRSLLETLNVSVVEEFTQNRSIPHKIGFLGPGRLKEIEQSVESLDFDTIVINGTLKPSQHHYLEMKFQKECIDRTGVILRIFAEHAHTPEAIAQVTLARLRYELPFLREWIHKAKSGDRPGFLSGGAYATDIYFEHAKTQARRIELNLSELSKQRQVTRSKRHAKGFSLVSLAGYTNAGKSALFNVMCGAEVEVDDHLFSTLSTTTRKVIGVSGNVLMVDTVGFIRNLPPDLVNAFNSTLEEIFFADLILLVVDSSEPMDSIKSKLATCLDILLPKMHSQSLVILLNKIDLIQEDRMKAVISDMKALVHGCSVLPVSARNGNGLDEVRRLIQTLQMRDFVIEATLPISDSSLSILSRLRSNCVVTESYAGNKIKAIIKCKEEDGPKTIGLLKKAKATTIEAHAGSVDSEGDSAKGASKGNEGAPLS